MASIFCGKLFKTVCFRIWDDFILAKPTQSCVFWPKWIVLGIAGKNSPFCQNSLTYRDSGIVIFQVFGSKWPQIRTTYLCRTQNTYGTRKGRYQVNLQEKINYNQNFSEFSETEAIHLKKEACIFFKIQSISILAICSPRHLLLLLEH